MFNYVPHSRSPQLAVQSACDSACEEGSPWPVTHLTFDSLLQIRDVVTGHTLTHFLPKFHLNVVARAHSAFLLVHTAVPLT
jgi:hypothetical protein